MNRKPVAAPAWLLPAVREEAGEDLANCPAWQALARRDPMLHRDELNVRYGKPPNDKWSDREIALRIIARTTSFYVTCRVRAWTRTELERESADYRARASRLHEEATKLTQEGPGSEGAHHAAAIRAAAVYCEERADWVWVEAGVATPGLIMQRHQGDPYVRGYCANMAEQTQVLYGTPLRGIVAAIASCALGTEVTPQRVRDWLKGCE